MVGHSHVALRLAYDGGALSGGLAQAGDEVDLSASRWLLNPGSVGQPRGGDPRAAWLMLDFDARPRLVPAHRVPDRADAGGDPRRGAAGGAGAPARARAVAAGRLRPTGSAAAGARRR